MKRLRLGILLVALVALAACTQQPGPGSPTPSLGTQADPGDLVINEILQNPSAVSDASGEWFELYNPTAGAIDIDGWTIADNDVDSHVISNGDPLLVPAGGYLVLGVNGDAASNGGVTVDYAYGGGFFLANGADELVLLDDTLTEIDRVEWDGGPGFPDPNGASMALSDPALDNTVGANWCTASTTFGDGDLGTPGAANDCPVGGAALVINEIDYDQASTDTAEFVEIANAGADPVDLSGYQLVLINGTGGGALVYNTIALPAVSLAAGDYFVVCANAATVPECDLDASPDTNFIQNGGPDAVALFAGGTLIDTVSYEGDTGAPYTEGSGAGLEDDPSVDYASISRFPDGVDTGQNNVDLSLRCATPGAANAADSSGCTPPGPPATPYPIHQVQGSGPASPLDGEAVVVDGIVVGDFQTSGLNGFFLQEPDSDADGDPATSEGIFVFEGGSGVEVAIGDLVQVTGTVDEFFDLTEITDVTEVTVLSSGNALPTPATVTLPVASLDDLEAFEGMSVVLPQALVISEYFNFDRFGEIVLSEPLGTLERPFTPTSYVDPGTAANAVAADNARSRITLDDGDTAQNPTVLRHPNGDPFALDNRFRGGDTVSNTVGVLSYSFGLYRIQPTGPATYTAVNPRPLAPDPVGGSLTVASLNVLNYFLTLDDGIPVCGPLQDQGCRGADDAGELARQRAKILEALLGLDADVLGLIELENTTGVSPLADLVAGLNDVLGAGSYAYIDTGTIGGDAIKVGLIYRPDAALPFGDVAILDSSVDPRFLDDFNRPVLAQSFLDRATGGVVTVAVNHLKSKGSPCDAVGDPNQGDGQGNCNLTRAAAAAALADWLATDPTSSGQDDALIIGDLNAYDEEDPIAVLLAEGYTDLLEAFEGEFAYSYVFDGQFGHLDYALSNASLSGQITGASAWHINADEPDVLDYDTSFKPDSVDAIFDPGTPFRASDHDPVVVGLALDSDVGTVIATLLDRVAELGADGALNAGQTRALTRHLEQALRQYERGRLDSARDLLNAFVDQVTEFVADGILTAQQGASLTEPAEALLAGL